MSGYSELIGSFSRMGNFSLEANYLFPTEEALKEFYSDPINQATLHPGLLKVVQNTNEQILYWVTIGENGLEFAKLISANFEATIVPKLNELITNLAEEIKERQNGEYAIWGTNNPLVIPEQFNSIYDLSEAVIKITEKIDKNNIEVLTALIKNAYYDSDKESLVLVFNLDSGETQNLYIPFTNVIREWEPYNGHPQKVVELTREEVYSGGADKLSADVRLSTRIDNILEKDGNSLLVRGITDNIDHSGVSLKVVINRLQKRIAALEKIVEEGDVGTVIPLHITSFVSDIKGPYEYGTTINPTFSWVYNVNSVDSQAINNEAIDVSARSKQLTNITQDTTVVLFASNKGYTDSATIELSFLPKIYYGTSALESISNVQELVDSTLGSKSGAFFNCEGGKYAYIAIPTDFKDKVQFKLGDFEMTAYTTSVISVVNSSNKTMNYTLFKFNNFYHGSFTIDIIIK